MKTRLTLMMIFVLAITTGVFAQNTVDLFDPVKITKSPASTVTENFIFGTKQVFLYCPTGTTPTGSVVGENGGGVITDNQIFLNNQNICPNGGDCFAGTNPNNSPFNNIGGDVEDSYNSVGTIDISSLLTTGFNTLNFNLVDRQFSDPNQNLYGSGELNLITSCALIQANEDGKYPVCHKPGGSTEKQKTLYVGSTNAVADHVGHGDTPGPCPGDSVNKDKDKDKDGN